MSDYMLQPSELPFSTFNEAREKRRKVLAAVRERRRIIYQRYMKKLHPPVHLNLPSNRADLKKDVIREFHSK
jgi:hypothetical protein